MYALALHLNPSTLSDHDSALYSLFWYFFSLESLLIKLCQQQETVCATLSCPDKQKIGVCDASLPNARLLRLPISEKGRKQQCGCWSGHCCSARALLTLLVGLECCCLWGKGTPPPVGDLWGSAVPCSCPVGRLLFAIVFPSSMAQNPSSGSPADYFCFILCFPGTELAWCNFRGSSFVSVGDLGQFSPWPVSPV